MLFAISTSRTSDVFGWSFLMGVGWAALHAEAPQVLGGRKSTSRPGVVLTTHPGLGPMGRKAMGRKVTWLCACAALLAGVWQWPLTAHAALGKTGNHGKDGRGWPCMAVVRYRLRRSHACASTSVSHLKVAFSICMICMQGEGRSEDSCGASRVLKGI